ncbi:helix-turn-helix domain-containing protein [Mesobacillus subterraneus]|uniref:helix-turn-helix domain-containing protein n=1 Tax=Mesobacillus subterraneus TaxID=285983 RepID=UPI001CFD325F|nr:helix-turn-helix domain-containing protein [Mesobacillus subterraneus]WLR55945.1 helix-turn-helix domain-containing protein [Mesobacillus subterraneus]
MKNLDDYSDTLTPQQIKHILGIGLRQTYELVKTQSFTQMRIGTGNLYSKEIFVSWLKGSL